MQKFRLPRKLKKQYKKQYGGFFYLKLKAEKLYNWLNKRLPKLPKLEDMYKNFA